MPANRELRSTKIVLGAMLIALVAGGAALFVSGPLRQAAGQSEAAHPASAAGPAPSNPWTTAQTVQPADFAKELADAPQAAKPTVVCVGPRVLYKGGHIPGALYHGMTSTSQGLDDLKKWAENIPRSTNVVVYCGCCPLDRCPNLRPAFTALHDMGFTHLRALLIPTNFYTDWVKPGYPFEKSE